MIRSLTNLFAFAICAQLLCADDFNRPDVAYTHDASKLGWYWQSSGNGHWSLKDHRIHVNNADPSRQETDQVLYHTRVLLKSGDWSATVAVRSATAGHHAGMVFMVGANGASHYQIGLKFGSNQLRILRSGAAGSRSVGGTNLTSSETFNPACFYTITAWSTVPNQFQWKVENPAGKVIASGNFNDAEYVSGYAGIIKSVGDGNPGIGEFDDFYVWEITVPPITRPHPRLLISAVDVSLIKMAIQRREEPRHTTWQDLKTTADRLVRSAKAPVPYTGRDKPFKRSSSDPCGFEESNNPDNIYFYGQLYQNHLVSHAMGFLLIGYALGDRDLVQFAVDSRENPRDFLELFEGMILMKGDTMTYSGGSKLPTPQDGEIIDRYRQVENHGLVYANLSLNQMMAMSETLFSNGINPYTRVGAHGETLEKPFEFYADFYRLKDSSIKGGYYKGAGIGLNQISVFEVANQRYPGNPHIEALLKSVDRAAVDAGGYSETYFCQQTLTHGVPLLPAKEEAVNPKKP